MNRTLDEEYEICQERGHTPKPRHLMAPPSDKVEVCAYCGTRYWTVTELREERPPLASPGR